MKRAPTILITTLSRTAVLLVLILAIPVITAAATIESYKARVEAARTRAIELENSLRSNEPAGARSQDFADRFRSDFPASERIEWQEGTVETANDWLLAKARAVGVETDAKKRLLLVIEVREQLSSILFQLEELEYVAEAGRSKDQDKQKLAEILRREEYQKPQQKQESIFQRWLREFLEWLESLFPKPSGPVQPFSGMGVITAVLQILLYGVLVALLAFIVYKVVPLIFPKLKRARKPKKKKDRVILGEHLAEDATAFDLLGEAEKMAREGNLRGAIRKGYIALLCDLSDRKVIGLARNKTNRDYLRDVRSRRDLHPRMKDVTDTFERHWYGFQESAEQDWQRFREQYQDAIRSV